MAEADITTRVSSLLQTVEALNRASDDMNTYFRTIAEEFVHGQVGLEMWLSKYPLSTDEQGTDQSGTRTRTERQLGWAKLNGRWNFAVREVQIESRIDPFSEKHERYECDFVKEEPIPLAQASRQERIAALSVLPYLLEAIQDEAAKALQEIKQATQLVHE